MHAWLADGRAHRLVLVSAAYPSTTNGQGIRNSVEWLPVEDERLHRDVLRHRLPWSCVPLLNGFLSKEMFSSPRPSKPARISAFNVRRAYAAYTGLAHDRRLCLQWLNAAARVALRTPEPTFGT